MPPYNGSGTYTLTAGQPVVAGTDILDSTFNTLTADLATALSTCITRDGQSPATANLPMGSFKLTGLAAGTANGHSVRFEQLQTGVNKLITVAGTGDVITGVMTPTYGAYTNGDMFTFIVGSTNTTNVTINIDGLGAKAITNGTTALTAGELTASRVVVVQYDGTQFQLLNSYLVTTGTGNLVRATSPTLITPALGTPTALVGTNITGTATAFNINGTVGATTPAAGTFTSLSDSGNLTFTGTGNRITGDMSNGTAANRLALQTSTANSTTSFALIPNGTGTNSNITWYGGTGGSDITNASSLFIGISGGETTVRSGLTGTGTYLPMTFYTGGSERARIDTSGNVGIGTTTPQAREDIVFNNTSNTTPLMRLGAASAATTTAATDGGFINYQNNNRLDISRGWHWTNGANFYSHATTGSCITLDESANILFLNGTGLSAGGNSNLSERMRIDSSGNVGIGTTAAGGTLNVLSNTGSAVGIDVLGRSSDNLGTIRLLSNNAGTNYGSFRGSASSVDLMAVANVPLTFHTNNAEKMRIDSSGNLLVGVTATIGGINGVGQFKNVNAGAAGIVIGNSGGTSSTNTILFVNSNGIVGGISTSGSTTAFNTSSDYRLKNTIAPMTGALDKVALLKPVTYKWNADGSDGQGFIAHELDAVVPGCVSGEKDATREEEYEVTPAVPAVVDADGVETTPAVQAVKGTRTVPSYQGVDTSFLVATLTAAIQEAHALIIQLQADVAALKR